jgi:hypothetical protein
MQPGQIAFLWIDWPAFHDWLERWAPLAEWGVAVGTIALAAATYAVARSARAEARAVSGEATLLTEQARALLRAYVYPEASTEWERVPLPFTAPTWGAASRTECCRCATVDLVSR